MVPPGLVGEGDHHPREPATRMTHSMTTITPYLLLGAGGLGALALAATAAVRLANLRRRATRLSLEPPAPAPPVPRSRGRVPADPPPAPRPRFVVAGRPGHGALRWHGAATQAEIRLGGSGDATWLELAPHASGDRLLPVIRSPHIDAPGDATLERTPSASRAHALLCDRLAQDGWEPCGRGDAWYAHRFRRIARSDAA
jgi:hypothetical protein